MQELQTSTTMTEQITKELCNGVTSDPAVWHCLLFVCPVVVSTGSFSLPFILLCPGFTAWRYTHTFLYSYTLCKSCTRREGRGCVSVCVSVPSWPARSKLWRTFQSIFDDCLHTGCVCVPFYGCECTCCMCLFIGTAGVKGCSDWISHSLLLCIFVSWGQCGDLPTHDVLNWCSAQDGVSKTLIDHLIFLVANYWPITILHDGLYNVLETTDDRLDTFSQWAEPIFFSSSLKKQSEPVFGNGRQWQDLLLPPKVESRTGPAHAVLIKVQSLIH